MPLLICGTPVVSVARLALRKPQPAQVMLGDDQADRRADHPEEDRSHRQVLVELADVGHHHQYRRHRQPVQHRCERRRTTGITTQAALVEFGKEIRRQEERHDGEHPIIAVEDMMAQTHQHPQVSHDQRRLNEALEYHRNGIGLDVTYRQAIMQVAHFWGLRIHSAKSGRCRWTDS
ncbi:hypothetical protein [Herbaspirillum sp. B65]|uniref:hypothetical protein n=1 Tax=Herbaspirillum sp. B65 TaxID=137708 RepID=UPI0018FF614B|nr:hypothetical protein [Herbaspirillum sp. B65]